MNKTNIKIQHGEKIDDNIKTTQNSPMPHVPFAYVQKFDTKFRPSRTRFIASWRHTILGHAYAKTGEIHAGALQQARLKHDPLARDLNNNMKGPKQKGIISLENLKIGLFSGSERKK